MKKIVIYFLIAFVSGAILGQDKGIKVKGRQEKIKQLKIAYFTEQLELSSSEAEKFWPLYNEMDTKIRSNRKAHKQTIEELTTNFETYKDEDFKKSATILFDNELAQTYLKKEYYSKIATIIGYKKATKLIKLEREFKQKLIQELKKRNKSK